MNLTRRITVFVAVTLSLLSAVLLIATAAILVSASRADATSTLDPLQALAFLAAASVGFVLLTMLLIRYGLDRMLLKRLFTLNSTVSRIRKTGAPEKIVLGGEDELSSLADNVEHLVEELDRSRQQMAQAEKAASEKRYRMLIENLSDVVLTMEKSGRLNFVSSAARTMFGKEPEGLVGFDVSELLGPAGADQVSRRIKRGLPGEGAHLTVDGCHTPNGPLDIDVLLTPLEDRAGIQVILRDVTARRRHENELLHMASHDFLTGLWNRRRFEDELAHALEELEKGGEPGAVLWLDLDGFKDVNDTLGHKAGDQLLANVAKRLTEAVRIGSTVARLGGDEFAVLLPSTDEQGAVKAAERIVSRIGEVVLEADGQQVRASTSLGIVLYPEHGEGVDELLARADMAMYHAKDLGRSRYMVFSTDDEWRNGIEDRRVWTEMVEMALAENTLAAYAQPIRSIASGHVVSYELLVRMMDLDGEPILPDRFLPVAERTGMIVDIDLWILNQAVRILEANPLSDFRLNINASARTLGDPRFLTELESLVTSSSIDPGRLVIEITETAIIVDVASVNDTLSRIKRLGCRVALDDFGSGFTSFLHLKQLPVDDIKIDGSFVRNVDESRNDQHLVRAMVEMAKGLNMQTTAEFVESQASLDMLRSFGVENVQGFVIGRPAPLVDVLGIEAPELRLGA